MCTQPSWSCLSSARVVGIAGLLLPECGCRAATPQTGPGSEVFLEERHRTLANRMTHSDPADSHSADEGLNANAEINFSF